MAKSVPDKRIRKELQPLTTVTLHCHAIPFDSDDYFESETDRILPTSSNGTSLPDLFSLLYTSLKGGDKTAKNDQEQSKVAGPGRNDDRKNVFHFLKDMDKDLPKSWYHRALWLWERPVMKLGRLTVFFAQLPSILGLLASQIGFMAGQITLPMLPPLLLGAGILLRSIWINAGYLIPRVSLTMLLLWGIWLLNSLIHRMIGDLTNNGKVSVFAAHAIMNWTEGMTLVIAGLVTLSLFGVNVSGLLLPAGICLALAAKDLAHNFLAGYLLSCAPSP